MAANQILSLPAVVAGATPISSASAWGFGSYVVLSSSLPTGIKILGLQFQLVYPSGTVDTTFQILFEIATGAAASEVTKIEVPFSQRLDTVAGYYSKGSVMFPEAFKVIGGTRLTIRVTDSITSAVTYQGVKIIYEELTPPTVTLQVPTNGATNQALLPTLSFTGTDPDADTIEYNVQVDTVNTFDSQLVINGSATETATFSAGYTIINTLEQLNTSGVITKLVLTSTKVSTYKVGSYYFSGGNYICRNFVSFSVVIGSNTINTLLTVTAGDYLGLYVPGSESLAVYTESSAQIYTKYNPNDCTDGVSRSFSDNNAKLSLKAYTFLINSFSLTDAGFSAGHPFTSGVQKSYTVQSSLLSSTVYYWRISAIDPLGSNAYGSYSSIFSFTTLAGSSTYNEGVTLTTDNSFTTILDLILNTTITLDFDGTIVNTTIADLIAVASVDSVHQINAINELIMEVSANMTIDATITKTGGLDFDNTITLDSDNSLIPLLELIIDSSTSLSLDTELLNTITMDAIGNTDLTSDQTLSTQTTLDVGAVVLLSLDQTITPSSIVDFIAEVALNTDHQVSMGIAIIFESSVSLETIQQFSSALDLILDTTVSLSSDHTVVISNIATMEEGVDLFTEQTISTTIEVILETVVFLDLAGSIISVGGLSFDASVFLTSDNVLIGAASLDIASEINLTIENQLAGIANLDVIDAIIFSSNSETAFDATLDMLTSMELITDSVLNEENMTALSAEIIYLSEHNISISGDTLAQVSVALALATQMSTEEAIESFNTIEQLTENQVLFDLVLNMYEQLTLNSETITTFDVINTINEVLGLYLEAQTIVEINQDIEALLLYSISANIEMVEELIPGGVPGNIYEASISLIAQIMLEADSPLDIFMKIIGVAFIKNINTIRG